MTLLIITAVTNSAVSSSRANAINILTIHVHALNPTSHINCCKPVTLYPTARLMQWLHYSSAVHRYSTSHSCQMISATQQITCSAPHTHTNSVFFLIGLICMISNKGHKPSLSLNFFIATISPVVWTSKQQIDDTQMFNKLVFYLN